MSINVSEIGRTLVEKHVGFGSESSFPERFLPIKVTGEGTFGRNAGDQYGASVAIDGDFAVVGVPAQDYDFNGQTVTTEAGAAYVYARNLGTWEFVTKLTPSIRQTNDNFGASVAISGDRITIGAPGRNGESSATGVIYVFEYAGAWSEKTVLRPTGTSGVLTTSTRFGSSLTMAGDFIIAGAPIDGSDETGSQFASQAGSAWVFYRNPDTKIWSQIQKLHAQGNDRNATDQFGYNVAGSGKTLAVGVPGHDYKGHNTGYITNAGAVLMFNWNSDTNTWDFIQKLLPSNRAASSAFGTKVTLRGDVLAVYASVLTTGNVVVFERNEDGEWIETANLLPTGWSAPTDAVGTAQFGFSVGLHNDTLAIGAPTHTIKDESGTFANAGAVYIYRKTGGAWNLEGKLASPDRASTLVNRVFGYGVDVRDNILVVGETGASTDADGGDTKTGAGAAWVFKRDNQNVWNLDQKISAVGQDRNASDNLGQSVAATSDTLVVGAPNQDYDVNSQNMVTNAGAVYIWNWNGTNWVFGQKLVPTGTNARNTNDRFGQVVAIDGDTIAVGVPVHGYDANGGVTAASAGAVFVFRNQSGTWVQEARVLPEPSSRVAGWTFGYALDVQGDVLVASSLDTLNPAGTALNQAGAVYVFNRTGSTWTQEAKVTAPTADQAASNKFGESVSYRDGLLLVGSSSHALDFDGTNSQTGAGAAWLYEHTSTGVFDFRNKFTGWGQDRNANDNLGFSIASQGNTLVVGAPFHSYDRTSRNFVANAGAAYVYIWTGTAWLFQQKIIPNSVDRRIYARFGWSVSIDGDIIAVGAPGDGNMYDDGASSLQVYGDGVVYVFSRTFGSWSQTARITPSGNNAVFNNRTLPNLGGTYSSHTRFGWSVAIEGNQLIAGQPWSVWDANGENRLDYAGSAYVFNRNPSTNTWSQEGRLVAPQRFAFNLFGLSVDIRDGIAIIGSPYDDTDHEDLNPKTDSGSAYIFRRELDGQGGFRWTFEQKLVGWGQERNAEDKMGFAVAGDNGTLAVGSPGHPYRDDGNQFRPNAGAVYVWLWNDGQWVFQQKITPYGTNSRNANDMFGQVLALKGDQLVVGAPGYSWNYAGTTATATGTGAAWVYGRNNNSWTLERKLVLPVVTGVAGTDANANFGASVAVDNTTVVVGAPNFKLDGSDTNALTGAGAVWVYTKNNGTWSIEQQIISPHRTAQLTTGESFGRSIAVKDDILVVGAPNNDSEQNGVIVPATPDIGAAYVFTRSEKVWTYSQKITAYGKDRNESDRFGYSMSYKNGTLVIGAPEQEFDTKGENYTIDGGAVYVWKWTGIDWAFESKLVAPARAAGARFGHSVAADGDIIVVGGPSQPSSGSDNSDPYGSSVILQITGDGAGIADDTSKSLLALSGNPTVVNDALMGKVIQNNASSNIVATLSEQIGSTYTIELWFAKNAATDREFEKLFSVGHGITTATSLTDMIDFTGGRIRAITDYNSSFKSILGPIIRDTNWHHVALVTNNGVRTLFVDGVSYGSVTGSRRQTTTITVGSYVLPNSTYNFNGKIDDFRVTNNVARYSTAFTPSRIAGSTQITGGAWVFERTNDVWNSGTTLEVIGTNALKSNDSFGYSVAIAGETVVVSSPNHDYDVAGANPIDNAGAAFVFNKSGSAWTQTQKLVGFGKNARAINDTFGFSLSVSDSWLVVGAPAHDYDEAGEDLQVDAGAAWVFHLEDGEFVPQQKLVGYGRDRQAEDAAGSAIAASASYLVVGAPKHSYDASFDQTTNTNAFTNYKASAGAVYVWKWSGTGWDLEQKLVASDRTAQALFGSSIAIENELIAIGAPGVAYNASTNVGAAYLFRRTEDALRPWVEEAILAPTVEDQITGSTIGTAVVLRNEVVFLGAPNVDGGKVFVFAKDEEWAAVQTLIATGTNSNQAGDKFGQSIAVVDDLMVIGAPGQAYDQDGRNQTAGAGAVYLFKNIEGTWTQVQKIIAWGHDSAANDQFGYSMAGHGNTLVVGAPNHAYNDEGGDYHLNGGAVYLWRWEGNPLAWRLEQKLTASDLSDNAKFGSSVSINADTLIVGATGQVTNEIASGAAYVFNRSVGANGTRVWTETTKLVPTGTNAANAGDQFGWAVVVQQNTNTIAVSAPQHAYDAVGDNALTAAGAIWTYTLEEGLWVQQSKIVAGSMNNGIAGDITRSANDQFGYSIDVRDNVMVVGAPFHDYDQNGRNLKADSGTAYVYSRASATAAWMQVQKLSGAGSERNAGDQFGWSVTGDGLTLAVGAPNHSFDGNGDFYVPNAGAVWIWTYADDKWNFQQKLSGQDGQTNTNRQNGDKFGSAISMSGEFIAVGAPSYDGASYTNSVISGATVVNVGTDYAVGDLVALGAGVDSPVFEVTELEANEETVISDPYWNQVRAYLEFDGELRNVKDNTLLTKTTGSVTVNATPSINDTGSMRVQGGGYININQNNDPSWNIGTGDFTVEGWYNLSRAPVYYDALFVYNSYTNGFQISIHGNSAYIYSTVGKGGGVSGTFAFPLNTWVHVALVRQSGVLRLFMGGNQITSVTDTAAFNLGTGPFMIGNAPHNTTEWFEGSVDAFRFTNGIARYTGAFTPEQPPMGVSMGSTTGIKTLTLHSTTHTVPTTHEGISLVTRTGSGSGAVIDLQTVDAEITRENAGAVFMFKRTDSVWNLEQKIIPTGVNQWNANDSFGYSVSLDGDSVAIGAPDHDFNETGLVSATGAGAGFVYRRTSGGVWNLERKFIPTGSNNWVAGDQFGWSVSLKNNLIVWGSPNHDYDQGGRNAISNAGAAYVYRRIATTWLFEDKITAWAETRNAGDNLSKTLAVDGEWLLVGAPTHDFDQNSRTYVQDSGSAYLFRWTSGSWKFFQKISPSQAERFDGDKFGSALAISGNSLVVAAPFHDYDDLGVNAFDSAGAIWTFEYDSENQYWSQDAKITPSGTNARAINDNFGASVDIRGDTIIAGAPGHSYDEFGATPVTGAGAAWIFDRTDGTWAQSRKVIGFGPNGRQAGDAFGTSVSVENDLAAASSPNHAYDADGQNSKLKAGAVWLFNKVGEDWLDHRKLETPGQDRRDGDNFGGKIAVSTSVAAIGMPGAKTDKNGLTVIDQAGAVQMYSYGSTLDEKPQSITLNGTSDFVKLDALADNLADADFTMAAWVRVANLNAKSTLFSSSKLMQTAPQVINYSYTGASETYVLPTNGPVTIKLWGATGGAGTDPSGRLYNKGQGGGYTEVVFNGKVGDSIKIEVGQGGRGRVGANGGQGGWPDGGNGASGSDTGYTGGGGGGSSRLWINDVLAAVAGGAGGGSFSAGGAGGGLSGLPGTPDLGGGAGTQTAGGLTGGAGGTNGSYLKGGNTPAGSRNTGGAGGGGYYGGGAGTQGSGGNYRGGGGGSGYVGGYTFISATTLAGLADGNPAVTAGAPANIGVGVQTGNYPAQGALNGNDGYASLTYLQTGFLPEFSLYTDFMGNMSLAGMNSTGSLNIVDLGVTSVTNGAWHHFALAYTKSTKTWKVYMDGVQLYSGTPGFYFDSFTTDSKISMGQEYGSNGVASDFASADIYDLAVWSKSLSSSELNTVYTSVASNVDASLIGNWVTRNRKPTWITSVDLGEFIVDAALNVQLVATDPNELTLTYSFIGSDLAGMNVSPTGLLTGQLGNEPGTYGITVRVTNSTGNYTERTFTVTVKDIERVPDPDPFWTNVVILANG